MLISEACAATKLTRKAIEYYIEQELVEPDVRENGYREFSHEDIDRLKKVAMLRKLGLGLDEIRKVLKDDTGEVLRALAVRQDIRIQREKRKQEVLEKLSESEDWGSAETRLSSAEKEMTIAERLLDAFPGYYGRFISLHFARFLNQSIDTHEQEEAYETAIRFLDNIPALEFPAEVQEFLLESTKDIGTEDMKRLSEKTMQAMHAPETFAAENKETIDAYISYRQSEEYRNSPAGKFRTLLQKFNTTSGYYDIFIPAIRKLSPSYDEYYQQLEAAGKELSSAFPEIHDL